MEDVSETMVLDLDPDHGPVDRYLNLYLRQAAERNRRDARSVNGHHDLASRLVLDQDLDRAQ